ncbi:Uncharacterised protein [marine metagenome]
MPVGSDTFGVDRHGFLITSSTSVPRDVSIITASILAS